MWKRLWQYFNPMAHIGEQHYPLLFPILTTIGFYVISEVFANFIWKDPNVTGTIDICLSLLLLVYFSFRSGIRGGLITTILTTLFFVYLILSHPSSSQSKESAFITATALVVVYLLIALIIGWLRQTIDSLFEKEKIARNVAEQKQRHLETLLEQLPVGVVIANAPNGKIISRNQSAVDLMGNITRGIRSIKDYKKIKTYSHGKKLKPNEWPLAKALLEEETITGQEVSFLNKKREEVILFANAAPVRDKHGRVIAAVSTFFDITKQKELEQQKDDFLAMASHELKTPLTSIKIYVQLLLKEFVKNPKAIAILTKMNDQTDRLGTLVKTMLDTARIEQGKIRLEEKPFVLRPLALKVLSDLQDTTKHKLIIDWQTNEYLFGNQDSITQVFTNLITNAIKYSPESKEIIVKSQKKDEKIIVSVQDFGKGIPKHEQKHIFDRFYQSEDSKTYPGLGLGLYISAGIIKLHGGDMWVESTPGKGSTFYFSLPIAENTIHKK